MGFEPDHIKEALREHETLRTENGMLRELAGDLYRQFHGVVMDNWSYTTDDFETFEGRLRDLGIEVDS